MNERIQQLSERALEIVSNKRMLKDGQLERTWNPNEYDQVFAELIVQECLNVLYANGLYEYDISEVLCDHFNVQGIDTQRRQPPLDSSYPDGEGYWK